MDKPFVECVKEIEIHYMSFPKVERFRIEKWIEKLALSSNANPTWRRHRDYYVRLLLSVVIQKKLTSPFDRLPPSGPLPSFPSHEVTKMKNIMGARESVFWRELYDTMHQSEEMNKGSPTLSFKPPRISFKDKLMPGNNIQNLTLIIKEQASRISQLEEQLYNERLEHEIRIKQLTQKYENDIQLLSMQQSQPLYETSNLKTQYNDNLNMSNKFRDTIVDEQYTRKSPIQTENTMNTSKAYNDENELLNNEMKRLQEQTIPEQLLTRKKDKKEVLNNYIDYLNKFQNDIKSMQT